VEIKALTPATWDAYAALIERHGGIWGGCWCIGFHTRVFGKPEENRARKAEMVSAGETHAALVFDGDLCVGWAQWGRTSDLPEIKNRKAYEAGGDGSAPDWRIPCFFTDKTRRRAGVAAHALQGALDAIAAAGGGVVEAYPEEIEGQKTSAAFLHGGTLGQFKRAGFTSLRKIGLHRWVVRKTVEGNVP
jgi:hypothetical protein